MKVGIIDTGGANHASIRYALERLSCKVDVIDSEDEFSLQDAFILPGVGHAGFAMKRLEQLNLVTAIRHIDKPVLGICLGMQLFYQHSEEGQAACLKIIPGKVIKMKASGNFRVPHMGWNRLRKSSASSLLSGMSEDEQFYFTHSFCAEKTEQMVACTDDEQAIPSIIEYKNFFGTQFHPEKSSRAGQLILSNFIGKIQKRAKK